MEATIYFALSTVGQRAAVLAGKPAGQYQQITGEIAPEDLDLCTVLPDGAIAATTYPDPPIKDLRPPQLGANRHLSLSLDAPPASASDVLAAMRAAIAADAAERAAREAADRERQTADLAAKRAILDQLQTALAADPDLIYSVSTNPCQVYAGRVGLVSIYQDEAEFLAHPAITELRRRNQVCRDAAAAQKAAAEAAKTAFIGVWLSEHGAPDQVERFDAAFLPESEYLGPMADQVFGPLADLPIYSRIEDYELDAALSDDQQRLVEDHQSGTKYDACNATTVPAPAWARRKQILTALPGATAVIRLHRGTFDHEDIPYLVSRLSIRVTATFGPFIFHREFAVPE